MSSEPNVASRQTLAIDIDEVLCYFVEPLASFAKSNYDATVDIDDFFRCGTTCWGATSQRACSAQICPNQPFASGVDSAILFCKPRPQYCSYTFREVWKCDEVESTRRVQAFFESDSFQRGLPTVDGAREALSKLSTKYRLVAVTSRQTQVRIFALSLKTSVPDTSRLSFRLNQ